MPTFKQPDWATTPTRTSSVVETNGASTPVDLKVKEIRELRWKKTLALKKNLIETRCSIAHHHLRP